MLSRLTTRTGRVVSRARPISTEARAALTNARVRAAAAIKAKADANIAAIEAMEQRQQALTEVQKSVVEGQSILEQQGVYQAKPQASSGSSGYNTSNIAMGIGALAALGLAIQYVTDEQAKKEEEAVKDEIAVLIEKSNKGLMELDGKIYDQINSLVSVGFNTQLPSEIKKNVMLLRAGVSKIPLSTKPTLPETIHSELANVRVETIADALLLLEQYRIAIGAIEKGLVYGKSDENPPNNKKLYTLVEKLSSIMNVRHGSSILTSQGPLKKELQGGRRRKSRKSRKSRNRKNRSRK